MRIRVLIVDDSIVYRSKIRLALSRVPWLEVVGAASNGKIALEMIGQKAVDIMTLDMEMPVMTGLQTLKELRKSNTGIKVIIFSSSTVRGSESTLEALACGADDFVAKSIGDAGLSPEDIIRRDLLPKIEQFRLRCGSDVPDTDAISFPGTDSVPTSQAKDLDLFKPSAIVIASSTGGPAAHEKIFRELKGTLRCPIFIAQHMPSLFTVTFAKRVADYSGLPCKEAIHGEVVKNEIYIAPGDFHLSLQEKSGQVITVLNQLPSRNFVRPAADYLFESAASLYRQGCMGFVLTGMGDDGLEGARAIKMNGGGIMIQDEKSCAVFGMPGAVCAAHLHDAMAGLSEIRNKLIKMALQ